MKKQIVRQWIRIIFGLLICVAGALVMRFLFAEDLVRIFEQLYPGYTLKLG